MIIQYVHFKVNAEGVVELCRQAWLYENKERWAIETIGSLAYGLPVDRIISVLNGEATLKNHGEDECVLVEERNEEWIKEVQEYRDFVAKKYLVFAGKKVRKETVDVYAESIVSRLRNAMRTPGFLSVANPAKLMELEDARQEMHEAIMKEAGFSQKDIDAFFKHGNYSSEELKNEISEFAYQLSVYVDNKTNWIN